MISANFLQKKIWEAPKEGNQKAGDTRDAGERFDPDRVKDKFDYYFLNWGFGSADEKKKVLTKGFHPHVHGRRVCISRSRKDSTLSPRSCQNDPHDVTFSTIGNPTCVMSQNSQQGSIQPNPSYPSQNLNEELTGIRKERYQNPRPPPQPVPNSHRQSSPAADLSRVQDRETRPDHFLKAQAWRCVER